MGDVGDDNSGGGFAGIPIQVDEGAIACGKVVVAIKDGGEDYEDTKGEDTAKDEFPKSTRVSESPR